MKISNDELIKANDQLMEANERMGLVYPELSYQIMGVLFRVHNRLGNNLQEKYYQRAVEQELQELKIPYQREQLVPLTYKGQSIGRYFLDFVITEKVAVETKTVPFFTKEYENQVLAYLDSAKLKLGIIANFRTRRLTYKRLINPRVKIL